MSSCSCEGAVSLVDSSFSRVRSRKRQEKRAAGHSLLHTVVTWNSIALVAGLNMQLGALRKQPQLRGSCFAKNKITRARKRLQAEKERARAGGARRSARQGVDAHSRQGQYPRPATACSRRRSTYIGDNILESKHSTIKKCMHAAERKSQWSLSCKNEFFKLTHWFAPVTNPVTCQRLSTWPKALFYG